MAKEQDLPSGRGVTEVGRHLVGELRALGNPELALQQRRRFGVTPQTEHLGIPIPTLRALARGHALVVTGPSSFQSFLDGLPHVAILFQYILDHEWIAERESSDGVHFYRLTPRGFDFWREGERWWHSLTWKDRLVVRLVG